MAARRTQRAFRVGGWAAKVAGVLALASAATVVAIGIAALTGRTTYPVDLELGPFHVTSTLSTPVTFGGDVCRTSDVRSPSPDCLSFFLHGEDDSYGEGPIPTQDADLVPTRAFLEGHVDLETTGGPSMFVAASVARTATGLAVAGGVLLLLGTLLSAVAAGEVFGARSLRRVRTIGWLVGGAVVDILLTHPTNATHAGYGAESFGPGPFLEMTSSGGVELGQLLAGALVLLLAVVVRHGTAMQDEQRLTV